MALVNSNCRFFNQNFAVFLSFGQIIGIFLSVSKFFRFLIFGVLFLRSKFGFLSRFCSVF